MEEMTFKLSGEIKTFLEEQAKCEGISVSEWVAAMLGKARDRELLRRGVREKLLEAIEEGPATPMTREDWDEIRREVRARHDARVANLAPRPSL